MYLNWQETANKETTMNDKIDIKSLTLQELTEELKNHGEKSFRAKQMYEWMHVKLARNFDENIKRC